MKTIYIALFLCTFVNAAPRKHDTQIDVDEIIDDTSNWKKTNGEEGKSWSKDSEKNFISKTEGDTVYVNCISSGSANKGCPIEFPWNNGGCSPNLPWNWNKGFVSRKCERWQVPKSYWDAGSLIRRVYEEEPINMNPKQYDKLMQDPKRFELLEKLRNK